MNKQLSILICGLKKREPLLMHLAKILKTQGDGRIEILANIDNGESSIGKKRNELLYSAKGEYVCFVDDDDMVSPYYTSKILKALETNPDCVGIKGVIVQKDTQPKIFIHSLQYNDWYEENGIYYRCPNHLNPIKRDIAKQVGFPDLSYQEDQNFSLRLKGFLKTESFIDEPLYYYYPNSQ
jgi:glycosyltransferase involved in cell wall biosynthesis